MKKKMQVRLLLFCILFIVLLLNCGKEEPIELLLNSAVERGTLVPDNWVPLPEHRVTHEWSAKEYVSGSHSLMINRLAKQKSSIPAWWEQEVTTRIPAGADLTFSVSVKMKSILGEGVVFKLWGYESSAPEDNASLYFSSHKELQLTGTQGWKRYSFQIFNTPPDINCIQICLFLGSESIGTVYFDDISLSYSR